MKRRISSSGLQCYVDELRRQVGRDVEASLSVDAATVIVVDSDPNDRWNLAELTRAAFDHRPFLVHRAGEPRGALECPFADVWFVVVSDRPAYDAAGLCTRLRARYPHVRIAAVVGEMKSSAPGLLAGAADWLCPDHKLLTNLSVCAASTALYRDSLLERIVYERVAQQVIATFGYPAANRVGLVTVPRQITTAEAARADLIKQALHANAGNCTKAARQLGVSRSTLYRWLDVYEIDNA